MDRIPTALMARLPGSATAAPLRLLDTGPDVFQLNDPSEQGCYGFETDRGGVQIVLPVTRPMDLRVANGASGRAVYLAGRLGGWKRSVKVIHPLWFERRAFDFH